MEDTNNIKVATWNLCLGLANKKTNNGATSQSYWRQLNLMEKTQCLLYKYKWMPSLGFDILIYGVAIMKNCNL